MTQPSLTFIRFENGIWHGHVEAERQPDLEVRYLGKALEGVELSPTDNGWNLYVQVPVTALSEGVHSFVIVDAGSVDKIGSFSIIAGEPAADDLRTELDLLRAELDMLKRAFRRVSRGDG